MSTLAATLTDALADGRARTHELIRGVAVEALETVHSPLLSPLVWDLGHIAAFEDLWISRSFGGPMLEPELLAVYDADETPRAERGDLPFLRTDAALDFLARRRAATLEALEAADATPVQELRLELILRHELQHQETMLQTCQIAGLAPGLGEAAEGPAHHGDDGLALVTVPGGPVAIGTPAAEGFAYDNERTVHVRDLPPFRIARAPVSNRAWAAFVADGGYARRELWSDAGWAWRTQEAATAPLYWSEDATAVRRFAATDALDPDAPVCHISCHEAEAFAAAHGLRLPTEFEWEAAAAAGHLDGATDTVWQWTASSFEAYPGFAADPYPEYSEQFFGAGYRVLRGGSWISSPRVATRRFRNWDHLERRQIFSGLRLAEDA